MAEAVAPVHTVPHRYRHVPGGISLPIWLLLIGILGGIAGIGGYTFLYAQGTSYFSDNPAACVNCHVMREMYDGWNNGSHKANAVCNDCHVPHDSVFSKYAIKALDGFKHSFAFTTGDFHEPIQISALSRTITQQNCLRCHDDLTALISHRNSANPTDCLRCHYRVGHEP